MVHYMQYIKQIIYYPINDYLFLLHLEQNVMKKHPASTEHERKVVYTCLMMNQTAPDMILSILIGVPSLAASPLVKQPTRKSSSPPDCQSAPGCARKNL